MQIPVPPPADSGSLSVKLPVHVGTSLSLPMAMLENWPSDKMNHQTLRSKPLVGHFTFCMQPYCTCVFPSDVRIKVDSRGETNCGGVERSAA